jgi:hypothetical protein
MRRVRSLITFTIPEAAEALGKSLPNFRRWITTELIPPPYLKDASRGHYCYCIGELQILARILAAHEREYAYFCAKHETVSNQMHQMIGGFRAITFGADANNSEE